MYNSIKEHKNVIAALTAKGLIDPCWMRNIEMYEFFLSLKSESRMTKYVIVSEKYKVSEERARKVIKEMEAD